MKKIYISIFALSIAISAFSQIDSRALTIEDGKKAKKNIASNSNKFTVSSSLPIWSEDFANGLPATWENSTVPWVYRGGQTSPSNAVGSQGAYASAGDPISSPTSNNGFLIFDSDYYDNNGVAGAFGTGSYPTPHNGELLTDMIDLSSYSDVTLKMNSYFRTYAGQAFIDFYVSGVFQERVQVHANLAVNESSFVDEVILSRIPFSVVGNADVQMSFVFEGSANSNNGFSGYYFWQMDDIELIETPLNMIEIEDVVVGGFWIDYANYTGSGLNTIIGLDYTVTPVSQLANHPYVIEGVLRNSGANDQTSTLKYEVYGAAGSYSGTSNPTIVAAYSATNVIDSMVVAANPPLSPALGTYGVSIWAESDSLGLITTTSDTLLRGIEISDYIYAKDNGTNINGSSDDNWIVGGPGDQWHFTTRFEMYADESLYALRAYISDESVVGAEIKAVVYELDTTISNADGGVILLNESDNYAITAQDLGAWVDIVFADPVDLYSGYAYEVGVAGFVHPTDSAFIGTSGQSMYNGEHSLFDEFGLNPNDVANQGLPTWYYLTRTPMVRMNFDPGNANSVADMKQTIFSTYPNPSNGIFIIELGQVARYNMSVSNVLGQIVFSATINEMSTTIDLSSFDKGIYTIELKNEKEVYTEKVIVE